MMYFNFILISTLLMISDAQRPSYAGSRPIGRPGLASRFKNDNNTSTTTSPTTVTVQNRDGEGSTTTTPRIPIDAKGDADLVNTLNSWDREHQPFWFINADHIEKARNTTRGTTQNQSNQNTQPQAMTQDNGNNVAQNQDNNGNQFQGNFNDFAQIQNQRNQALLTTANRGGLFESQNNFGSDRYPLRQNEFGEKPISKYDPYNHRHGGKIRPVYIYNNGNSFP